MIFRTFDELNRVTSCTDTAGKTIGYAYNEVGDLTRITYPDGTEVNYDYDANHNLKTVTDWANRVTSYEYDENNNVTGITKPDGSVTTTVYDDMQRVTSTVDRSANNTVITGFEYTYDDLSRIVEEKHLAEDVKMCYTYDELSRVTARTVTRISDGFVLSAENFVYDAAGNVIGDGADGCFQYDTNNRLTVFNGNAVEYDADGNMLSNGVSNFTYDSANRLVSADGSTYVYNAEDVRIRAVHNSLTTVYTYNTNAKLSQLLVKETNGVTTKYVYGLGLIGEEVNNSFKTYHYDYRGSTVAITNVNGTITDTFTYNTYGKLTARTGSTAIIFGYNGRDGVITEPNGLIYMRARYYSPDMRRFINADIIPGEISNAVTLNRYAYANGNPVMFVDPNGNIVIVESKNDRDVISTLMVLSDLTDYPLSYNWETKEVSYSVNNHSNNFPIGNELISTLIDSHHTVTINAIRDGFSGNGINRLSEDKVYYNETGGDARITFDLNSDPKVYTKVSSEKYSILQKRPAYIGLAHELIHALHYVQGTVQEENYKIDNYYYIRKRVLFFFHKTVIKTEHYKAEEFYTVGLSDFKDEKITENAIRKEHQIPKRTAYTVPY